MSYCFSGAMNDKEIDAFQDAFNREVLPKVNEFLKKYNLATTGGTDMKYDSDGIKISCDTEYRLASGEKPWEEHNYKNELDRAASMHSQEPAFQELLEGYSRKNKIIGRLVQFPNESKKNRNKIFEVIGYKEGERFPIRVKDTETGKTMGWAWIMSMKFVD